MKKFLSILLVIVLMAPIASRMTEAAAFKDVSGDFWAYAEIQRLSEAGILKGKPDGTFDPNGFVTRGQFALILYRALNLTAAPHGFADVPKQGELADAVGALVNEGIAGGYADGKFGPNDPMTRGQMAVMITRALGYEEEAVANKNAAISFDDRFAEGLRGYVKVVSDLLGIMTGTSPTTFSAGKPATRAQTAVIINRMLEKLELDIIRKPFEKKTSQVEVHFIDVGQGDAIYIALPNHVDVLIDAGHQERGQDVVKYLRAQGVDDIEYMIATHPDVDHIGGFEAVLEAFTVENVFAPNVTNMPREYEDFLAAVKDSGLTVQEAKAGVEIFQTFTCMAIGCPPASALMFVGPVREYGGSLDDRSAVVWLKYGSTSFLFTGDATELAERDMLAAGLLQHVDVLKVGNHGSPLSTSRQLLDAITPKYAVISVGKDHPYGYPSREVLNRLSRAGIKVYRTDESGTIVVASDGSKISFNNVPREPKITLDTLNVVLPQQWTH